LGPGFSVIQIPRFFKQKYLETGLIAFYEKHGGKTNYFS